MLPIIYYLFIFIAQINNRTIISISKYIFVLILLSKDENNCCI